MREVVVDIGCGLKNNLEYYGYQGEPTIALDLSREFLDKRQNGNRPGNLLQADSASLPLGSDSADQIYAVHVLEHVDNLEQTLSEMDRVLKPGGEMVVAIPHPRYEAIMGKLDDEYHSPKMHQRIIPPETLCELLEEKGYRIAEYKARGFVNALYVTLSYLLHRKLLKDKEMEEQSGRLISRENEDHIPTDQKNGWPKVLRKSPWQVPILALLNKVYPFETFVIAKKRRK